MGEQDETVPPDAARETPLIGGGVNVSATTTGAGSGPVSSSTMKGSAGKPSASKKDDPQGAARRELDNIMGRIDHKGGQRIKQLRLCPSFPFGGKVLQTCLRGYYVAKPKEGNAFRKQNDKGPL
jgi:hypothetical protein